MCANSSHHHILLILTGGTICSFPTEKGEQASDTKRAQALIVENFRSSTCKYRSEEQVHFDVKRPLDVLSENMTIPHWNTLLKELKSYDFSLYDGVILLHGTDTLAYTAAFLSILLSGISIPVLLVSSQLALYEKDANGNANFRAAVELIVNGIYPNVYAVYRNEELIDEKKQQTLYVHYAAHLLQCANHSNHFYSCDMTPVSADNATFQGKASPCTVPLLYTLDRICASVLKIEPYVGIDYSRLSLEGVDAIVHGTYHSSTVAVNPDPSSLTQAKTCPYSILYLKEQCTHHTPEIPLFLEPCNKDAYSYETTGIALRSGIRAIHGLTSEMAYVKVLLGCSLGLRGDALYRYIHTNINNEFIP